MSESIEVANVLLQNAASDILLLQRAPALRRAYLWGLPGGLIDPGEVAEQAALRELEEETGIPEAALTLHGIRRFFIQTAQQGLYVHNLVTSLKTSVIPPVVLDPNESIAYRWTSLEAACSCSQLIPGLPTIITEITAPGRRIEDLTLTPDIQVTAY